MMFEPTPTPSPQDWWAQAKAQSKPQAGPAQTAPTALVPLTPPPVRQPTPQTPVQSAKDAVDLERARVDLANAQQAAQKKKVDPNAPLAQARDIFTAVRKARDTASDWSSTGYGGAIFGSLPQSSGRALQGYIDTIKANLSFDRLSEMRANSPTGAGLGSVSDTEGRLLASTVASLDPWAGEKVLRENLTQIERHYTDYLSRLGYTPEQIDSIKAGDAPRPVDATGHTMAGAGEELKFNDEEKPPTGYRLSPAGETAYLQAIRDGDVGAAQAVIQREQGFSPDRSAIEAQIQGARSGKFDPSRGSYGAVDAAAQSAYDKERYGDYLQPEIDRIRAQGVGGQFGSGLAGFGDTYTAGLDAPIAAGLDSLGNGRPFKDNLQRVRAGLEAGARVNPVAHAVGQIAGAIMLPSRIGSAINTARIEATAAGAATREVIAAGRNAGARRAAIEGGAYGGVYGGSEHVESPDRLSYAALGAGTGALSGYGITKGLGRLADRFGGAGPRGGGPAGGVSSEQAAQSADALDIVMPRYVGGTPAQMDAAGALEKSPFGVGPIRRAQGEFLTTGANARDKISTDAGSPMETVAMGDTAREGLNAWRNASRDSVGKLYDKAHADIGDAMVSPQNTIQEVSGLIREEQQSLVDTPAMGVLEKLTEKLANGDAITVEGARKTRTALRESLGLTMTPSNADRVTNRIMAAIQSDIERDAPQAAASFKIADTAHRDRLTNIRDVLEPFIGKRGDAWGSEVARHLINNSKSNGERLQDVLRLMPKEAADDVRATLISRLGQSTDGAQNAAGDAFSYDTFLTNWNQIKGSRERIFSRETYRALNQLAEVAEKAKQAGRSRNFSNTGAVTARDALMAPVTSGVLGGTAGFASGSPTIGFGTAAAGVGITLARGLSQHMKASMLAKPMVVRRIANTPGTTSSALRYWRGSWVNKLARSEPSVAADLLGMQEYMVRTLSSSVPGGRLAAEEGPDQKKK